MCLEESEMVQSVQLLPSPFDQFVRRYDDMEYLCAFGDGEMTCLIAILSINPLLE
jgi:hypothetical protein